MLEELPERYFYSKNRITKVGKILKEIFPKGKTVDRTYQKVKDTWKDIVGEETYKLTEITGLRNRILYISVESTAMIHHLTNFEKCAIISKINDMVGSRYIDDIRFKVGSLRNGR